MEQPDDDDMEQLDDDEMEQLNDDSTDDDSTATSRPASGSGDVPRFREVWFKGCHSGMYFIRAITSEPVWNL